MFFPVFKPSRKLSRKIIEQYSLMEHSGLIMYNEEIDDLVLRFAGDIYVDGEGRYWQYMDGRWLERRDLEELREKVLSKIEEFREVNIEEKTINGVRISRWI